MDTNGGGRVLGCFQLPCPTLPAAYAPPGSQEPRHGGLSWHRAHPNRNMKLSLFLAALSSLCHALSSDKEFSFGVAAKPPRLTETEGLAESVPSSSGSRKLLQPAMTLLQTAILQKHNDLRAGVTEPCTASDMQVLEWDDALAAAAATYASQCIWAHEESKNIQMVAARPFTPLIIRNNKPSSPFSCVARAGARILPWRRERILPMQMF